MAGRDDSNRAFQEYRRAQNRRSADRKDVLDQGNHAANKRLFNPRADISGGRAKLEPASNAPGGLIGPDELSRAIEGTTGARLVRHWTTVMGKRPKTGPLAAAYTALERQEDQMLASPPLPAAVEYSPLPIDRGETRKRGGDAIRKRIRNNVTGKAD